jgi:hypothetical protein
MNSGTVDAKGLANSPLDAAADFYARIVPAIREAMARSSDLAIVFDPADHSHSAWRLAAVQEIAREAAPCRVNGLVASRSNLNGTAQALQFLHDSPGISGQLLTVDANAAETA